MAVTVGGDCRGILIAYAVITTGGLPPPCARSATGLRGPMGMLEVLPALVWVSANALTIMGEAAGIDPRETLRQVGQYHADDRNYHE